MHAALARARGYLRELGSEPAVILCGSSALLIVSHYQGSTAFFSRVFPTMFKDHPAANALPYFWWFAVSIGLYLIVPLALSYATRGKVKKNKTANRTPCWVLGTRGRPKPPPHLPCRWSSAEPGRP